MKRYFLICFLLLFIFLAGCINQPDTIPKYKNDIITVEKTIITNSNPTPGSTTSINILLKNNGDKTLDNVEMRFDNIVGLILSELYCEDGEKIDYSCVFNKFGSLETRNIKLVLKVPEQTIRNPFIEYSISYPYKGQREARIPVVSSPYVTPKGKFSQSLPSVGPVLLEFEFPPQRTTRIDKQEIKEYWVVANEPFELKIKLKYVGSITGYDPIIIPKDSLVVDLNDNFQKDTKLYCEFEEYGGAIYPREDVKVPSELICNLKSVKIPEVEIIAPISAEFSYTFRFRRKETLTVKEILK
ncbi:MAG: hypothetical protein NZ942_01675 [Candidatus Aenigmarchaeota archaeon]|nr:hypothetical protein [Candidatus Aenigmarchaeota archaeon]